MNKKKYLLTLMSTILSLGFLFGCADGDNNNDPVTNDPGVDQEAPGDTEQPGNDTEPPATDTE